METPFDEDLIKIDLELQTKEGIFEEIAKFMEEKIL